MVAFPNHARMNELSRCIFAEDFATLSAEHRAEIWEELFMGAFAALLRMENRAEDAEHKAKLESATGVFHILRRKRITKSYIMRIAKEKC